MFHVLLVIFIFRLSGCNLSHRSCETLSSVVSFKSSSLRELDLGNNNLQGSGLKLVFAAVESPQCTLGILRSGFSFFCWWLFKAWITSINGLLIYNRHDCQIILYLTQRSCILLLWHLLIVTQENIYVQVSAQKYESDFFSLNHLCTLLVGALAAFISECSFKWNCSPWGHCMSMRPNRYRPEWDTCFLTFFNCLWEIHFIIKYTSFLIENVELCYIRKIKIVLIDKEIVLEFLWVSYWYCWNKPLIYTEMAQVRLFHGTSN